MCLYERIQIEDRSTDVVLRVQRIGLKGNAQNCHQLLGKEPQVGGGRETNFFSEYYFVLLEMFTMTVHYFSNKKKINYLFLMFGHHLC